MKSRMMREAATVACIFVLVIPIGYGGSVVPSGNPTPVICRLMPWLPNCSKLK